MIKVEWKDIAWELDDDGRFYDAVESNVSRDLFDSSLCHYMLIGPDVAEHVADCVCDDFNSKDIFDD